MTVATDTQLPDVTGFIIEVETEGFNPDDDNHVRTLQHMVDTGLAFRLQGWWGRFADQMIRCGIVNLPS